jgi:hypothetical protein
MKHIHVFVAAMVFSLPAQAQFPYTVNHLADGSLISSTQAGKDGWVFYPGTGDPAARQISVVSIPGVAGKAIRGQSSTGAAISRRNDERFSFLPFQAGETNAVSMFDLRYRAVTSGNYIGVMGLAADGPDQGEIIDQVSELGPVFGMQALYLSNLSSDSFSIRGAGFGTYHFSPVTTAQVTDGEWIRLRLVMNLVSGTGSLSFKNLSRGHSGYTPVPNLQDVNLQLDRLGAASQPVSWNAVYLRLAEVGSFPAYDLMNLVPHYLPGQVRILDLAFDRELANGPFARVKAFGFAPDQTWVLESSADSPSGQPWIERARFTADNEYETMQIPVPAAGPPVFLRLTSDPGIAVGQ